MEGKDGKLIPCLSCNMSFCCSEEHWDAVRKIHAEDIYESGRGMTLTQCNLNTAIRVDEKIFYEKHPDGEPEKFLQWNSVPRNVATSWRSLQDTTWDGIFKVTEEMKEDPEERILSNIREESEWMSMPLSILYGLEMLKPDLAWTEKDSLLLHVSSFDIC
jgi:mitochondrial splicing suppressor protein 51